jgi:hypothetical protein
VRLTTGLRCWPGRQMNPTKGGASRQSCTCTDSSVTHGSTGRRIPEGKAATQIEPQDRHGIDWITQISQINRASILRDFAGLESPERICGPLPDQTRIRPYFWPESDSGVPSDSPPKLTGKRKLLESLPKPLIFNIFSAKNGCRSYFNPFTGVVKSGVITPPSSESGVITKFTSKFSSKSTAMASPAASSCLSTCTLP